MAEPEAFEIVGVYDDRLSPGRVPSVHVNVQVRGSVANLVNDSREEKIDVIAVALPLSAVQRISFILEHLSGTVADVCLTTDLAGLTYRYDQFGAVGSNPVISIGETPLKDWQSFKEAGLDYVAGAILVAIFLPVFALLALAIHVRQYDRCDGGAAGDAWRSAHHARRQIDAQVQSRRAASTDQCVEWHDVFGWTSEASAKYQGRWPAVQRSGAAYALRHRVKPGSATTFSISPIGRFFSTSRLLR
jgi:CoA-binding domain